MNNLKTKILWYWISWGLIFATVLLTTILSPEKIKFWGTVICLCYWIFLIFFYIKEYNGLKEAVLRRFPEVYEKIFKQSTNLKDKFVKINDWDTNPLTKDMYNEDLNIKNRLLKLNELDFFKNIVFISVIAILITSLITFK